MLESNTFGNNLSQREMERIGERFVTDFCNWVLSSCMHVQAHSASDEVGRNRFRWEELLTDLSIWVNHVNGFCRDTVLEKKAFQNNLSQRERVREYLPVSCAN